MSRYTETELIALRDTAYVPTTFDFAAFAQQIQEQKELSEEQGRRGSHLGGSRPKFQKKPKQKHIPQADEDGWFTNTPVKKDLEEGEEGASTFATASAPKKVVPTYARPNNKNIGSSRPADPRDVSAAQPKTKFNAFSAFNDSEDEDEDEDDE
ncbi:hypothetical protein WICPIJ_000006 [Wickerhamomyces pijperi]|uniref:Cap-associated protein CAF20 n=1 Tax=Wickerhamomyces pijperi TaxID=599730 RepID=A0A9P8QHU5_WICPI|nr:hypothetical protein WICPIJ_000006 [Wickerhamomyces pijperi]